MFSKRSIIAAASLACAASLAQAQISDGVVKIGVLSDMSSLYSDIAGSGSTVAARMAVEDFGAARKGMKVEILSADHLNKPDVGSSIARQWYDVDKVGGKVRQPLNAQDFASFLLQAQASKAKIVGLANAGGDTTNSIKQAAEFGIVKGGQSLAGMLVFISDIHGLGLDKAQGLIFTETFYWDLNDQTRAFAKRFAAANGGKYPTMVQAGVYSAITHYLKAVEALKGDDGTKVIAKMKELPTDDPLFGKGRVRMDGRKLHPAYLVEVKKPSESKGPYDYYKIRATIPADQAFRPLNEGGCSLVK